MKKKSQIIPQPLPKDILQKYMQEVSKYPVLSPEEEKRLSLLYYEKKDLQAFKILVQSNLRFVVKIALQYSKFGTKLIDLIQEGNTGLLKAIHEFNPYKGVRLISYAVWWIRGSIQEYLLKQHSIVRVGTTATQKKLFYLLKKENLALKGTPLNTLLLSNELGVQKKDIDDMKNRIELKDVSLDTSSSHPIEVQKTSSLDQIYKDKQELQILRKVIQKIKKDLNEKELYTLENRILSDHPLTLQEIGKKFNVTREYIRQIESKIIQKVKTEMDASTQT